MTGQVKTKTTFSRPRPLFLKTIKLLTQDLKNVPLQKNQASYAGFDQSCRNHAGNRKKHAYCRLSSQVLLHPILGS